jgi:hypothetical protein
MRTAAARGQDEREIIPTIIKTALIESVVVVLRIFLSFLVFLLFKFFSNCIPVSWFF